MDENNVILECEFEFKCPKKWENLTVLADPEKRFCTSCEREVFFITTRKEFEIYKKLGRCVAAHVYNPELGRGLTITGGISPRNTSTIHVLGNKEEADEIVVALNRLQRKKQQIIDKRKQEEEQI
ncbi:MAG: hypothetical protein AB1489_41060 [Acidobacteriota bacterium]